MNAVTLAELTATDREALHHVSVVARTALRAAHAQRLGSLFSRELALAALGLLLLERIIDSDDEATR